MLSKTRLITFTFSSIFLFSGSAFGQKAAIEADVKGVDGRPSRAAEVRIERQDKKSAPVVAKTNWRGHVTVADLEVGTYKLTTTVEGGIRSSQIVKTQANKTRVAFDMSKTSAMTGKEKKKLIWVASQTGSNLGGHWVEVNEKNRGGKSSGQNVETFNGNSMDDIQRQGRGFSPPASGGR
jgi:hypothetical protein